jgi:hypothetical protein
MKYIKAHNTFETFGEHLSNKKHVQIFESLKNLVNNYLVYDKGF